MLQWFDNFLRSIASGRTNGLYVVVGVASSVVIGVVSYRYIFTYRCQAKAITPSSSSSEKSTTKTSSSVASVPALHKTRFEEFELIEKIPITHNTKLFRFKLPEGKHAGVPVGQHVSVQVDTGKAKASRHYTPVSDTEQKGHFDLVIKMYEDGKVTPLIHGMQVGDKARIRGPSGSFKYKPNSHKQIGMLAAGTGITPMWKVIQSVVQNKEDKTELKLLFANRTEDDVLFEKDLKKFSEDSRVSVDFLFSQPKDPEAAPLVGRISEELVKQQMPPPGPETLILVCGPHGFSKAAVDFLKKLGYARTMFHRF